MTSSLPRRCLLCVDTESDETVASRILHLLTVRGEIPEWFIVRKSGGGDLRITVELADVDRAAAESVKQKILKLPTVIEVSTAWLQRREPVMPERHYREWIAVAAAR